MKKLSKTAIILCIAAVFAAVMTGCGVASGGGDGYTAYYVYKNGVRSDGDWFAFNDGEWQYSDYSYGTYSSDGNTLSLFDENGVETYTAVLDGDILAVTSGENTVFYYKDGYSFEKNSIGIDAVFIMAQNAGYDGTLEDLVEAFKGDSAYETAVKNGYVGSETEWLATLIGAAGANGISPHIGANGDWYVGDTDTGVSASGEKGDAGVGIESVAKTATDGNVDTYTISLTDGTSYDFTVTNGVDGTNGTDGVSVTDIEKTSSDGKTDTYTITMSDEKTYTFTVTNGSDAEITKIEKTLSENGTDTYTMTTSGGAVFTFNVKNGTDGEDGITPETLFDAAKANGYGGTYLEFITQYLKIGGIEDVSYVAKAQTSTVSVLVYNGDGKTTTTSSASGSGVVYSVDKTTGDAVILTNYHVVYDEDEDADTDDMIFDNIKVYVYGSEVFSTYNDMGVSAEYIGGSQVCDIAVLKISGSDFLKTSCITAADFGDSENAYAGEEVIAVGNAEGEGISVTKGIIDVVSEDVAVDYVSTRRYIRTDAAVNPGNSGGGLYDTDGVLLGIVGLKMVSLTVDDIGYAIPINVAVSVAKNIIAQYEANATKTYTVKKAVFGMTVYVYSSEAVYDEATERNVTSETVKVLSTNEDTLCYGKILKDDIFVSVKINDGETVAIDHIYKITDLTMQMKENDVVVFVVSRKDGEGNENEVTVEMTVAADNMAEIK